MAAMRELKGRIDSVHSSQKITSAMKMISSAKLRKAEQALRQVLPFKKQLQSTLNHLLANSDEYKSPLTEERPVHRVALVVFGSDEGLCGGFNVGLFKKMAEVLARFRESLPPSTVYEIYPIGKKIYNPVSKMADLEKREARYVNPKNNEDSIKILAEELISRFISGEIDRVETIFYYYKSVGTQLLKDQQLLPVKIENLADEKEDENIDYIFEPDQESIFQAVLPLYIRSALQESWMQSRTSEQAARIMAMQMANDNANKLLDDLQLEYNKLRQQNITAELLDILGGTIKE